MKQFVSGRPYWWQWTTILSLDAPAVGLTWQALFARVTDFSLHPAHRFVLGVSIWCAYAADRWIEGLRLTPEQIFTQRHFFTVKWRWQLFTVWCAVLIADLTASFTGLTHREFSAGLVLLVPVLLYLFSHQLFHRGHPWRLPKEICVAALISGGAVIFVAAQPQADWRRLIGATGGFALLAFANCVLISIWEREVDRQQQQDSLAISSRRVTRFGRALPWLIAVGALAYALALPRGWDQRTAACVAASAALLGGVDLLERRAGRQLARALADFALLTPLIALVIPLN